MKLPLLAGLLICSLAASAQDSLPLYNPRLLHIRFPNDAGYRVAEGRLVVPPGKAPLSDSIAAIGWWSRVSRVSDATLRSMRQTATRNLGRELPDPTASFHFHVYDAARMEQATRLLKASEAVRQVRRIPVPRNAQAPNYTTLQRYIADPACGINADSVYIVYKNRGAGIQICDIEYDFHRTHTDLPPVTVIGPAPLPAYGLDHATAVLGELGSIQDTIGTTGIASDSKLFFAGAYTLSGADSVYDLEGPILNAAASFRPGDVILLEQQIAGPNYDPASPFQEGLVPVEWFEPYYDAIALASANGIVIVEAAGNGNQNLDGPEYNTGNNGHYPFTAPNNSGAIIVGAGSVGTPGNNVRTRARLSFSNYGSRVDVQGNGEQIVTTGYGDLYATGGEDYFWTSNFGGTSGASPIVTGAVALLQSVYKSKHNGSVLSPKQVRDALVNTGRPQLPGPHGNMTTTPIGPLPDVYAAIRSVATVSVPGMPLQVEASLAPNPAGSDVTITYRHAGTTTAPELTMFNALGARVYREALPQASGSHRISVAALPAGVYQVRLSDGQESVSMRLLVSH